jgi:hypothetical protein
LKTDPIKVEIEGVEHGFSQPINKLDEAFRNNGTILSSIIPLMKSSSDWSNLPSLLAGLYNARGHSLWPKSRWIVREASRAGQLSVIMQCVERPDKSGYYLDTPNVTLNLLGEILEEAIAAEWDKTAAEKALKKAERVLELLEDPKHLDAASEKAEKADQKVLKLQKARTGIENPEKLGRIPLARDPLVLAHVLNLAAIRAILHTGCDNVDHKVAKLAKLVIRVWPTGKAPLNMYPEEFYSVERLYRFLARPRSSYFLAVCPALNGLELAAQILPPAIAEQLEPIVQATREEVERVLAGKDSKAVEGLRVRSALSDLRIANHSKEKGKEA